MAESSNIEWTDCTWNPIGGCSIKSPGCHHCYAATMAHRLAAMGQAKYVGTTEKKNGKVHWTGKINVDDAALKIPLGWKKPRRIFVNSMSDLFHEDVPNEFIEAAFSVMARCPQHTFQVLTKRADRMRDWFRHGLREGWCCWAGFMDLGLPKFSEAEWPGWPLPNVWLGVSVEDQARADERIHLLLQTPAVVRFLSCEPLLSAVNLHLDTGRYRTAPLLNWVIVGGESGPGARPMHPDWARSLRDQCQAAGVPFFFKQWGEYVEAGRPTDADEVVQIGARCDRWVNTHGGNVHDGWQTVGMDRVGKKDAGRMLDGRTWDEFPNKVMP